MKGGEGRREEGQRRKSSKTLHEENKTRTFTLGKLPPTKGKEHKEHKEHTNTFTPPDSSGGGRRH